MLRLLFRGRRVGRRWQGLLHSSSSPSSSMSPPSSSSSPSSSPSPSSSTQSAQEAEWRQRLLQITEYYSQYEAELSGEEEVTVEWIRPAEETFPVSTERGVAGVFDLQELVCARTLRQRKGEGAAPWQVAFLRAEKALAIVAARAEGDDGAVVLCSPFSRPHMRALFQRLHKLYKKKKWDSDPSLNHCHKKAGVSQQDWLALNMGNVVLHIMTREAREEYDLEQLLAVGPGLDKDSLDARAVGVASAEAWLAAVARDRQPPPRIAQRSAPPSEPRPSTSVSGLKALPSSNMCLVLVSSN